MNNNLHLYKKAMTLAEVDNAVRLDVPITPDHAFYTDFSDVRGCNSVLSPSFKN
jgi:hypothetical protein